jgi:hypothetical protein
MDIGDERLLAVQNIFSVAGSYLALEAILEGSAPAPGSGDADGDPVLAIGALLFGPAVVVDHPASERVPGAARVELK